MSDVVCCPLSGNDGDVPGFWHVTRPRARLGIKAKCEECGVKILRGVRYERTKYKNEGRWSTYTSCLSCAEIRDHFACNGFLIGQLWDDLENNFFPDMKMGGPCMDGLSPEAKGRLVDERMRWYFEQDEVDDSAWENWNERRPT